MPCFFIRFSGCNLWEDESKPSATCPWCDTPQLHRSTEMTTTEIRARIAVLASIAHIKTDDFDKFGLVLTGGEPLLQLDVPFLERIVFGSFGWVDVETNGTVEPKFNPLHYSRPDIFLSCSPKTARIVIKADWYKVLVPAKTQLINHVIAHDPGAVIYLQPVEDRSDDPITRANRTRENLQAALSLSLSQGFRLSIQLHKILSLP
jgi:organic radical activating enzyme